MKKDFPSIKISGVTKKVYSLDLSGGGSEPSTLRLSFVWGKENYDLNTKTEISKIFKQIEKLNKITFYNL